MGDVRCPVVSAAVARDPKLRVLKVVLVCEFVVTDDSSLLFERNLFH